ncbi:MAG: Crp/Fnr family transcriptional regulator [Acidimicrobiia bacterium]|nr:Crp/Fnr family transcriptional regulator [Acidimicrobiia bacterium]
MSGTEAAPPRATPATGSFLALLDPGDRLALEEAGVRRLVRRGEMIVREGEPSTSVVALLDGVAKVTKVATDGREALIELRGPGELLGELGAVDGAPRSASVTALTTISLLVIPAAAFRRLLADRAGVANAVLAVVVARVRRAGERQLEQTASSTTARVSGRLAELAESFGRPRSEPRPGGRPEASRVIEVDSPISQQELADWVGASRDAVVRALTELRGDGVVETSRQRFTVLDPDRLRARSAGA